MELSIVIPVYNEGLVAEANLLAVERYLDALQVESEIIVVNDGSTDDTLSCVDKVKSARLVMISYAQNQGKGYAVGRGMGIAKGRYRLFMDMDLSTDLDEIGRFLEHMRRGECDVCVGNRHAVGIWQQQRPWHRALLGKIFAMLSTIASGCRLGDFTCGFKMFTAKACELVFPQQKIYDWSFDTELIAIAQAQGLRIHERPVSWKHHANSKVFVLKAIVVSLKGLLKVWVTRR